MKANQPTSRERLNDDAIMLAATLFSKWVLEGKTYEVDYSDDPPWDHSGRLVEKELTPAERLSMYETLGQWMHECHTGQSMASYESGCGFYHDSFSTEIEDAVRSLAEWLLIEERGLDKNADDVVELVGDDAVELWVKALEVVTSVSADFAWEIARFAAAQSLFGT